MTVVPKGLMRSIRHGYLESGDGIERILSGGAQFDFVLCRENSKDLIGPQNRSLQFRLVREAT